jgi:hypothetical protein
VRRSCLVALLFALAASAPGSARAEGGERPLRDTYNEEPDAARPPPLTEDVELTTLPKERHLDVGPRALLVTRLAESEVEGERSGITYDPAPGVGAWLRVLVHRYFQVGASWTWATHKLSMERGALGIDGSIETDSVTSYSLELHLMPTLPIGDRVKLWGSAGVGWGRHYYPPMHVRDASGAFTIRDRAASFVDFPLGIGGMVEIVPQWLSIDLDVVFAPTLPEDGSARIRTQTIDGAGRRREVGPIPGATVSFIQALGLSVLL